MNELTKATASDSKTPRMKAYKIITSYHDRGGFSIYSANTAGRAKTICIYNLQEAYSKASYKHIEKCVRAPEYDILANKHQYTCIAWHDDGENFEMDRGHWYDHESKPKTRKECMVSKVEISADGEKFIDITDNVKSLSLVNP
jgi:hypothetical protein